MATPIDPKYSPSRRPLMSSNTKHAARALVLVVGAWLIAPVAFAGADSGPEKTLKDAQQSTEQLTALLTALATDGSSSGMGSSPASGDVATSDSKPARQLKPVGPSAAQVPKDSGHVDASGMERSFERILDGLRSGSEPTTSSELAEFVDRWPQHALAHYHLARLLISERDYEEAIRRLAPFKSRTLDDWQPWFWSATANLGLGRLDAARTDLEGALSRGSDVAAIWVQEAVLEQELGNHAGAVQLLQVALSKSPADAQIHLNLAYSFEHLGEFDRALSAYQNYLTSSVSTQRSLRGRVLRRISALSAGQ